MAIVTCVAVVRIARHAVVLVVHLALGMAGRGASEHLVVACIGVAVGTLVPFVLVLARIDGEVLSVMVPVCGVPGSLRMAGSAVGRELCCCMVGIGGLVVVGKMAAHAGVRDAGIISVVASLAGKRNMGAGQYVVVVMGRECCGCPSGICCMTGGTGRCNPGSTVVGVGGIVVVGLVASHAGVGRAVVIPVMAGRTGGAGMTPGKRVIVAVDREGSRAPAGIGGVAGSAGNGYAFGGMVGVVGSVVAGHVAGVTVGWCACEAVGMTGAAGCGGMRPGKREVACAVVKRTAHAAGRMALVAVKAHPLVASHTVMLLVGLGLVMVMAVDAAKGGKAVRIGMAVGARLPGTDVLSRIDREVRTVVHEESGRLPAWICSMAVGTAGRYVRIGVVGVGGGVILLRMAGEAIGGCPHITVGMAKVAGGCDMCAGKREFTAAVVKRAFGAARRMAFVTGDAGVGISYDLRMFLVGLGLVVVVAVDAAEGLEAGRIRMAVGAGAPCACMLA